MFEADDVRGWWASLNVGSEGSDEDPVLAPARVFSLARWKINLLCWSAAGACLVCAVVLTKLPQSRQITRSSEAENKLSKPVRIKIFWNFSLYWQTDDSTFLYLFYPTVLGWLHEQLRVVCCYKVWLQPTNLSWSTSCPPCPSASRPRCWGGARWLSWVSLWRSSSSSSSSCSSWGCWLACSSSYLHKQTQWQLHCLQRSCSPDWSENIFKYRPPQSCDQHTGSINTKLGTQNITQQKRLKNIISHCDDKTGENEFNQPHSTQLLLANIEPWTKATFPETFFLVRNCI